MDTNPLVPWMDRSRIADRAEKLRQDYQSFSGQKAGPPFPVEALIEQNLGLTLEYDDLEELIGEPDILGALWVEEKRVVIDNRLLDSTEGRFCFTCAHEVGHWTLHRDLLVSRGSLNRRGQAFICRKVSAHLRVEWQANTFASCLLMPEEAVSGAFRQCFGPEPLVIHNRKSCLSPTRLPGLKVIDPALENVKEIASWVIEAGKFSNVSKEAMRYRLEDLGLLINNVE